MRIQDLFKQQAIQGETGVKKQDQAKGDDAFASLLSDELSGLQTNSGSNPVTGGCDPMSTLAGISGIPGLGSSADNSALAKPISAIEETLAGLDSLGQALQQNTSPKDIHSMIDKINTQAAGLDDKLSSLPADHPLKDIAEQVKIAAYTESVKWNRGDYL